ncbi:hypothetical protein PCANC_25924 [Puccinia coronata f. sp. avenae]|uniref:Uncharacterized protein n=1 Tax=Puccinia coronata f. sp. avenae TaxID=200324 RepID=A0A2N5RX99_9BASI|nr:hypothetical protein PCANC_27863 [Puccinia coronata f. sp. avenae]PLW25718.1 hypothetical protein PCANC_25924 [Puccinia coronata f. sp. avenae]
MSICLNPDDFTAIAHPGTLRSFFRGSLEEACNQDRMLKFLDLPEEIIGRVFSHLITPPLPWGHSAFRQTLVACTIGRLRLVCRAWADWLYEHHLYRVLSFENASRALAFIDLLGRRSNMLPRAKCQYLEVDYLWTDEDPPQISQLTQNEMIGSVILESLLGIFSDTIITLDLKFVDFFTLPSQTIQAIGRLKNLQNLRLDISQWPSGDSAFMEAHPACFDSLLTAARGLKSLQLALPVSLPRQPDLTAAAGIPAITHLKVDVDCVDPAALLDIAIVLKPSLKSLSLGNCGEIDVKLLLPVFETLNQTLQGLFVTSTSYLTPILSLGFPNLRVLAIHGAFDSNFLRLNWTMFCQLSIEAFAITYVKMKNSPEYFTLDMFSPLLKEWIFMKAPPGYSPPPIYLNACEARHVKCISVGHEEVSLIM